MYSTLKSLQNADGLKVSLNDEISKTLDVIKAFWGCAGSKINNSKNECILLEDMKNEFEKLHGIRVTNKIIKCKLKVFMWAMIRKNVIMKTGGEFINMENHLNLGNVEN